MKKTTLLLSLSSLVFFVGSVHAQSAITSGKPSFQEPTLPEVTLLTSGLASKTYRYKKSGVQVEYANTAILPIREKKPWLLTANLSFPKMLGGSVFHNADAKNAFGMSIGSIALFNLVSGSYRNYHTLENNTPYHEIHLGADPLIGLINANALYGYEWASQNGFSFNLGGGAGLAYSFRQGGGGYYPSSPLWLMINFDLGLGYRF